MSTFVLVLMLGLLPTPAFAEQAATRGVTIASSDNFPPVNFLDEDGVLTGFGRELSDAVFRQQGIAVERLHSPLWPEVMAWLSAGRADLIHDAAYSLERDREVDFSDPILEMDEVIFVLADRYDINDFSSLRDKAVACVNRHITHLYLRNLPGMRCHLVDTPTHAVDALLDGQAEALVFPKQIALYYLQQRAASSRVKIVGKPLRRLRWSMIVREGDKQTLSLINSGLRGVRESGEYEAIYTRWFGQTLYFGYKREEVRDFILIAAILSLLAGALAGLWIRNTRLRKAKAALEHTVLRLQSTQHALEISERRFRDVARNLPGAIYQFRRRSDGTFTIPYVSDGIEALTGISAESMMRDDSLIFSRVEEEDLPALIASINESMARRAPWTSEFRIYDASGRVSWVRGTSIPHIDADGTATWNGMLLDISDLKDAQRQLQVAHDELEERVRQRTEDLDRANHRLQSEIETRRQAERQAKSANHAKSEFLSRMSHELRTPLNAILGFGQLLEMDMREPDSGDIDAVREINRAGGHLLELINDVLELSRIDAGEIRLDVTRFDLAPILRESMVLSRSLAEKYQVDIELDEPESEPLIVRADKLRVKQVLLNLLSNAIKYNRPRGKVTLRASRGGDGGDWRISVRDTGMGLDAEQCRHLFEPFNRLGAQDKEIEGTGIGLVITRHLVELMGGRLEVQSTPGEGSCFSMYMPGAAPTGAGVEARQAPAAAASAMSADSASHALSAGRRVLYVEDNPANMRLVKQILSKFGIAEVLEAVTGEEGVEVAIREQPDSILMDINLPGMSGIEAMRELRADPRTAHIPVIALSADAMPEAVQSGLDAGFAEYLTKPVNVAKLMKALKDVAAE